MQTSYRRYSIYGSRTPTHTHYFYNEGGDHHEVVVNKGVDQGCAMAAAFFAIVMREITDEISIYLTGKAGRAYCYLDDLFLRVNPSDIDGLMKVVHTAVERHGAKINNTKTAYMLGKHVTPDQLPEHAKGKISQDAVLGKLLMRAFADEDEEGTPVSAKVEAFVTNVSTYLQAGLTKQNAFVLTRAWALGSLNHAMRLQPLSEAETQTVDNHLKCTLDHIVGCSMTDKEDWGCPTYQLRHTQPTLVA